MTDEQQQAGAWERVSLLAFVYFLFGAIPSLINFWPALVGILAAGEEARAFFWNYGLYLLILLIGATAALSYWLFRFQVLDDRIQVRSGVFNRKHLILKFERVQQADIAQPFYLRPFGLAVLGLESAGSAQQEVEIPGLTLTRAQALKSQILAYRQSSLAQPEASSEDAGATGEDRSTADYQLKLPWREVARYGLMHNGLILFLPLLGPFLEAYLPGLETWLESSGGSAASRLLTTLMENPPIFLLAAAVTLLIALAVALVYAISVTAALLRYWDYTLRRHGDRYEYRAGLTTVRMRGFRLHKLQLITLRQGIFARLLRRSTMTISKAGGGSQQPDEGANRFLIPVLDASALADIKRQLELPTPRWQPVHWLYPLIGTATWGCLATVAVLLFASHQGLSMGWSLCPLPTVAAISWRRWYCLGFDYDGEWVSLRTGFLGRALRHLPTVKVQKVTVQQPPWLRGYDLATISLWSTDGALTLPYIPMPAALRIRETVLRAEAEFQGKWI